MKRRTGTMTAADLATRANPANPRKISPEQLKMLEEALKQFGDLSGLILNETTGHLVGGHQRVKLLGDAPVEITRRYSKPSRTGTVAEGFATFEGERFTYRVVRWEEAMERAAMVAANKHGGDWDFPALAELLMELDKSEFDLGLTGFTPGELEKMVKAVAPSDEITTLTEEELNVLPAHVRMVQLFLNTETLPPFLEQVRALQEGFGESNITDTVVAAVNQCYHHRYDREAKHKTASDTAGLSAKGRKTSQGATSKNGTKRQGN